METMDSLDVVRAWQAAANEQDVEQLIALSDPAIEVVGPRGVAHGHRVLREWLGRAGLHLTTLRTFACGPGVVMAQRGVWRSVETDEVVGEALVASRFRVAKGRVVQFARYDDLTVALVEGGLGEEEEVEGE